MLENLNKKEGIKSRGNAKEPEKKKTNGSNSGAMLENPNKNEGIESGNDA